MRRALVIVGLLVLGACAPPPPADKPTTTSTTIDVFCQSLDCPPTPTTSTTEGASVIAVQE